MFFLGIFLRIFQRILCSSHEQYHDNHSECCSYCIEEQIPCSISIFSEISCPVEEQPFSAAENRVAEIFYGLICCSDADSDERCDDCDFFLAPSSFFAQPGICH